MIPTILIAESSGFSRAAIESLRPLGSIELADLSRRALVSRIHDADIVWVRLRNRIDKEVMDAAPRLRAIATATTGLNHIDVVEAQHRNIQIISLRGENEFLKTVYATAEHTMALIFALLRRLPPACQHVTGGGWNRDLFIGRELHGKTAGIIGYGRVGQMVAHYLAAFGMRVCITDPGVEPEAVEPGIELVSLDELLQASELVSLHVAYTEGNRRFFGRREFELMKPESRLINTARGELIDERALLRALRSGHLAGAALDVLSNEGAPDMNRRPIIEYARFHDNLLITPHIGGCTSESREKTENFLADRVAAFMRAQFGHGPVSTQHPVSDVHRSWA
jgi:D-3-phosphoglycerate dehydrogenase / 2-oxoglutarate reductase